MHKSKILINCASKHYWHGWWLWKKYLIYRANGGLETMTMDTASAADSGRLVNTDMADVPATNLPQSQR